MSMPPYLRNYIQSLAESQISSVPYKESDVNKTNCIPWDLFDGKFVLAYTGNKKRIECLNDEFKRVGMNGVEVFWNTDDEFAKRLFDAVYDREKYLGLPYRFQFFNNALGHYRIIKGAYCRGMQHILVMEDDIRFLRDIETIRRILTSMPKDYDVAMLDSHPTDAGERAGNGLTGDSVNEFWRIVERRTSAGCYALSRTGMEKLISLYEQIPLRNSDENFKRENFRNIYYCNPCAARQVKAESENTASSYSEWSFIYDATGCKREMYGK